MPTTHIKLHPNHTENDVRVIRERAAMIVSGSSNNHQTDTQYRWSIDVDGNNWWFGWEPENQTISISSRYAGDDIVIHVRELLIWAFDLERYNLQAAAASVEAPAPRRVTRAELPCEQEEHRRKQPADDLIRWKS